MNDSISVVIEKLEAKRKQINNYKTSMVIFFIIGFVCNFFGSGMVNDGILFSFIGFGFILFSILFYVKKISKEQKAFKDLYKNSFVVGLLNEEFDNVYYNGLEGYTKDTVKSMGLVSMGNRFNSEDYLKGTYNGVNFSQSDVTIKDVRRTGKSTTTVTYFVGRMFEFEFPKQQVVGLKVFSDNFGHRSNYSNGFKLKKVKLEDVQFNKKFDVTAVTEHEAFYVLTPHMMENIRRICDRYGNVAMHISAGKLYLGFNTSRNTFDADLRHPLSYPEERAKIKKDIEVITNIIDVMQLED